MKKILCILPLVLFLSACDPDFDSFGTPQPIEETEVEFSFFFDSASEGWTVGFSDFDPDDETRLRLTSGIETLPEPLNNLDGLRVSGTNQPDSNLFMFVTRRFTGLEPNSRYELDFEITFASNAPQNCDDPAGEPGEDVFIKAGATTFEPEALESSADLVEMNLDKGSTFDTGGSNAIVLGDFANTFSCDEFLESDYEERELRNSNQSFTLETDGTGDLWLLFGTDSGFEGRTSIFYLSGEVLATLTTE